MTRIGTSLSQNSLRPAFYPTQGVNETFGEFNNRFQGFRLSDEEQVGLLRRMCSESSGSSRGSFKEHFSHSCTSQENSKLSVGPTDRESYFFKSEIKPPNKVSSQRNDYKAQALIERPEIRSRDRETGAKQKITVLQRLLNLLTKCFMPCTNVKL